MNTKTVRSDYIRLYFSLPLLLILSLGIYVLCRIVLCIYLCSPIFRMSKSVFFVKSHCLLYFQAYRIEPLVLKHYSTIAPLKIHKIHEAKKVPYSEMKSKAYAAFGKAVSQGRYLTRLEGERERGVNDQRGILMSELFYFCS